MAITFHFQTPGKLTERTRLKSEIRSLMEKEGKQAGDISYIFCSDEYLLGINNEFLQHDYYTDIITFDNSIPGSSVISGELYISLERVKDNAAALKFPEKQELIRVIFHGILHLCGYADKSPAQQKQMRDKENYYLNLFHYS